MRHRTFEKWHMYVHRIDAKQISKQISTREKKKETKGASMSRRYKSASCGKKEITKTSLFTQHFTSVILVVTCEDEDEKWQSVKTNKQ